MHPIDSGLAKQWIKRRLTIVFPELGYDPEALEQAYQALSLEPRQEAWATCRHILKSRCREPDWQLS